MRKLLACAAISAGLLLPAAPASATEAGPIAGVKECPDGFVGVVVYKSHYSTGGEYDLVRACVPADTRATPESPAGATLCPTGDVGIIVWAIDPKTGGRQEVVRACILITP